MTDLPGLMTHLSSHMPLPSVRRFTGRVDDMALHGGCPVIEGTKWAANLWVWNGPRYGYGCVPQLHSIPCG